MITIDCISDLHGYLPDLQGGDLLIVAGDLTARDSPGEHLLFAKWLLEQEYRKKIFIAGNHDGCYELQRIEPTYPGLTYLCDSGCEFMGLRIWGSPYTPEFCGWHFMKQRGADIRQHWDLIPANLDILVTHGPPYGILDQNGEGHHVGCEDLAKAVREKKPRFHVFGHIHEANGVEKENETQFINCSLVNEQYEPVNRPMRITLS